MRSGPSSRCGRNAPTTTNSLMPARPAAVRTRHSGAGAARPGRSPTARLRLRLAPHSPGEISHTARFEIRVERSERAELRDRDHRVATSVTDQALNDSLLVVASDPTEMMREQEMGLEPQELAGKVA